MSFLKPFNSLERKFMNTEILSDDILKSAFHKFIKREKNEDVLKRYLWYPHSAEKWFQLEFLYALDSFLPKYYHVAAEKNYTDLLIYQLSGIDQNLYDVVDKNESKAIQAIIELKFIGNWWLRDSIFKGNGSISIGKDIKKVDDLTDKPGVVLIFAIVAIPTSQNKMCQWINKQIKECCGVDSSEQLLEKMKTKCNSKIYLIANEPGNSNGEFKTLEYCLYGYRNQAAIE